VLGIGFRPGDVMNAIFAFRDNRHDFFEAILRSIGHFHGASRNKPGIENSKN
jgi:hypothetical protein